MEGKSIDDRIYLVSISDIKRAVDMGKTVHMETEAYNVIKNPKNGDYLIKFIGNGHCVGLHGVEGTEYENKLNGKNFFFYENI